jgi:hypothetical protein
MDLSELSRHSRRAKSRTPAARERDNLRLRHQVLMLQQEVDRIRHAYQLLEQAVAIADSRRVPRRFHSAQAPTCNSTVHQESEE